MFLSIVVIILLLIVFYRFAIRGKVGNFSGGIGNALFQAHRFLRPTTESIIEVKKQRQQDAKQGDDNKPPELPPWAQSGD